MASERHKTRQKCKRGDQEMVRKRKGGEEALCKNSWRERESLQLRQGGCAGCLQPSPPSPPRCRGRCDLRADGTSDGSHAAAGAGRWPAGGSPTRVRGPSAATGVRCRCTWQKKMDEIHLAGGVRYAVFPRTHHAALLKPRSIQHFSPAGLGSTLGRRSMLFLIFHSLGKWGTGEWND